MTTELDRRFASSVQRHGPLGVDVLMELALYDPDHGFYSSGAGSAGRRGADFLTSPEVGPLFGAVLARALDRWWDELGRPDPFHVVEAAAGSGMLARTVLAAEPRCRTALTYVLVERSPALRAEHGRYLPLDVPAVASPPRGPLDDDGDPTIVTGQGPRVVSAASLPRGPLVGVVVANELLDNLPTQVLERTTAGWAEVRLGLDADGPALRPYVVPAPEPIAAAVDTLVPDAAPGARVPWQREAAAWLQQARDLLVAGRIVLFDYGRSTAEMATVPQASWLRTYRGHGRGGDPFTELGTQDITVDVALDQLERVLGPGRRSAQAEFLRAHGIDELVEEGRRIWHERAHLGDLEALRARSRVREAEALLDPDGLGGFWVLDWSVG